MSFYLLADCNNFYVSCERLFNPRLDAIPVIVLSNNDGCIVARSSEAKALSIPMGAPFFQVKDLCEKKNVAVLSSNYSLYADLSKRVMHILSQAAFELEVYSIDEAFLKFPSNFSEKELICLAADLRRKIKQWIGIPISIGIARTKTLAKLANSLAKKETSTGVFSLLDSDLIEVTLKQTAAHEIWGIGKKLSESLRSRGVFDAYSLSQLELGYLKKWLGVITQRIAMELQQIPCLDLQTPQPRKAIQVSRSFGEIITDPLVLKAAISHHVSTACAKLRAQKSLARALCLHLETKAEGSTYLRYYHSKIAHLESPSCSTSIFLNHALDCFDQLFNKELKYKKCGIILLDFIAENDHIPDFFEQKGTKKEKKLMKTIDQINAKFGKNTLFFGRANLFSSKWQMHADHLSKKSTTDWQNLAIVYAK